MALLISAPALERRVSGSGADRRASRRIPIHVITEITGVKVQSEPVKVIDASREGLLIECGLRLPPGTASPLEIIRREGSCRLSGKVVRCEITYVQHDSLIYRVAFSLRTPLDFIDEEFGESELDGPVIANGLYGLAQDNRYDLESALQINGW